MPARFVAFSADLLRWETPQRLVFEEPPGGIGYTYHRRSRSNGPTTSSPSGGGYAMLLAQGFMRLSKDLRNWGPPRKALPQDLYRNRLLKGRDGTLWAVYETSSPERQPIPGGLAPWLLRHRRQAVQTCTELRVSRSVDGIEWRAAGKVVFPGQPGGLWAFASTSDRSPSPWASTISS